MHGFLCMVQTILNFETIQSQKCKKGWCFYICRG